MSRPIKVNVPMPEEIKETYLEIRQIGTGKVVTVIEVLSPKKISAPAQDETNTTPNAAKFLEKPQPSGGN